VPWLLLKRTLLLVTKQALKMSSVGEYKTVGDVISDLNVMIVEAPIPNSVSCKLAYIVSELEAEIEDE